MRGLAGVADVQKVYVREVQTDVGPAWVGAPGVWNGADTGGLAGTKGERVVVGVIVVTRTFRARGRTRRPLAVAAAARVCVNDSLRRACDGTAYAQETAVRSRSLESGAGPCA